ncbi:hypothetical protein ACRYCC_38335 [Actinomadura scrupuli]|uniref:hypothetical protein n=1 Tax=Actinomadura scrupuli TaxID=559629 RepID=UPI003D96CE6D
MRRRLVVVTPSLSEAVRFAGGLVFDRVMDGWDVTVLRADHADSRPVRILGARVAYLEPVLASPVRGSPQAIAVHADLYDSDERVRRMVLDAHDQRSAEVSLWGDPRSADADEAGSVRHRLSVAAQAFKAQALVAAAVPADAEGATELFRHWRPHRRADPG